MSEITKALTRRFHHDQERIIFWYDEAEEMTAEFDALDLAGVTKLTLDNNQFAIKHRMLRAEPAQKFLLYHKGARPINAQNWLLDVELAHRTFAADQAALWLTAAGLPNHYGDLARAHAPFFKNDKFVAALKALDVGDDSRPQVLRKMVAVCLKTTPNLSEIMGSLLIELAGAQDEKQRLLARCGLDAFLWEELERTWGYTSETPSVKDLTLTLLRTGYATGVGDVETVRSTGLNVEALDFLRHWQNNRHNGAAFATLSAQAATDLDIEADLQRRSLDDLVGIDLFELIDRRILHELVRRVADRTLDAATCEAIVHSRSQSFWFDRPSHPNQYLHPYRAVECAAQFLQMLDTTDLTVRSLRQGVDQYAAHWYLLDQRYRQLIYHSRQSGLPTLLAPLLEQVE
ncbi:MAG: BREX-1 system phosphatase PglZ type A, partial [Caldilineaceae bacterium]|nr:BREX-1 system phosphatase PglZ type A [Caldilineaceae bacterium]